MKVAKKSAAVSEATTVRQSLAARYQGEVLQAPPRQKAQTIYFNLCAYDISDPDDPKPVEELQAGETYLLAIACDSWRSSMNKRLKQERCSITDAFFLRLSFNYDVSITTPIIPVKEEFSFDNVFVDQFLYEFTLPTDLPECRVSIKLALITVQRSVPVNVANYTVLVHGQQATQEIEICKVSQINQRLPEQTAILLIESLAQQTTYKQRIRFRGWSDAGQQLDDTAAMSSIVSIEELQAYRQKKKLKELGPQDLLNRLTHFSRKSPLNLLHWLNRLSADYAEQLNLIIVDLTEMEIPWELLEFGQNLYLGACARVVRWLPTQYFTQERELYVEPGSHEGPVISYLDDQLDPGFVQDELDALRCLTGKPYTSLSALRERLKGSLEEIGLIYVGCHGMAGKHLLQQNVPELSSIMLEGIYKCELPRLIVFINACESARTIKKTPDDTSNFVDTFLAYCASGFIGTLAQVDIRTASEIAGKILRSALQPDGVQIAEKLRILRKLEVEQLKQKIKDSSAQSAEFYRLIDTFMYVYYGNPLTRLRLHRREGTER